MSEANGSLVFSSIPDAAPGGNPTPPQAPWQPSFSRFAAPRRCRLPRVTAMHAPLHPVRATIQIVVYVLSSRRLFPVAPGVS